MQVLDVLKEAGNLAQKYKNMELYEQLLTVREELSGLREELIQLKEENKSLKERLELQAKVVFENGLYWIRGDRLAEDKDTPICPRCWDVDNTLMRLKIYKDSYGKESVFCYNCKTEYYL